MNPNTIKQILLSTTLLLIVLFGLMSPKKVYALPAYHSASVALVPNTNLLVSGSNTGTVQVWDVKTGEMKNEWVMNGLKKIDSLAVTSDGKYVFLGLGSGDIVMLDLKEGKKLKVFAGHKDTVTSLALSSDNKRLISGAFDSKVKIWDIEEGKVLLSSAILKQVASLAIRADDKGVVVGQIGGKMSFLDFKTLNVLKTISVDNGAVISLVMTKDGREVIAGLEDGKVKRFTLSNLEKISTFDKHEKNSSVFSVVLTEDEKFVVSGAGDKSIRIWERLTGKEISVLRGHKDTIYSLALSSDGKRIVSSSSDGTIKIWNFNTGEELRTLRYK